MISVRYAICLLALLVAFTPALAEIDADDEKGEEEEETKDASHGFGTDIDWVQWDEAITTAIAANKPIMLLIHKTWCGACQQLKKSFASSNKKKELLSISQKFVMSNTEDDEEPEDAMYAPDGGYIPRILFLDKYGEPLGVHNKKNFPNNAYYYPQVPDVIRGMKEALKVVKKGEKVAKDEEGAKDKKKEKSGKDEKAAKESEKKTDAEEDGAPPAKPEKIEKPAKKPKEDSKTEKEASKKVKKETESGEKKADKKEGGCPHAKKAAKEKAEKTEKATKDTDEKAKPKTTDSKKKEKSGDGAEKKKKKTEL